ncbi:FabG Dehydrogenase with different specificities related to short-chain alcohol dehydrogenase [Pyrenophora tritici-repentis]|nr:Short chain dehydrogenase/reductase family oxidoreductase [Pyrenophora tritici-repentis]KAI0570676.1 Short chain dehydrogenase/reductase family oxidoreductase [Pyrenophora tritici-repentis]KAI0570766.1 Short chain dehydrogenase/reductase family oxidoreductase [Pyrenophora tritici-repentis]KAI0604643.1 Short chain dehydrogenase/reductase family oxidoreductase [Pyrenophora tritici-repentis]KAI0616879.1 Short chain dehydrogenase/reductase family oxidoreductase [Pyrenophora tritici-repentis]
MGAVKYENKTVFVAGGAGGLGKAVAKISAARGAHVTIFGRSPGPLDDAAEEIRRSCRDSLQKIKAVVVDLSDYVQVSNLPLVPLPQECSNIDIKKVDNAFRKQGRVPDMLYCAAGGNHAQNGFFTEITSSQIEDCMRNNYFATAYLAKSALDLWVQDDRNNECGQTSKPIPRQIVIVSSAAAFVALPGSIAYTPAKAAVRALADTLRLEMLRYSCAASAYSVHIAFPGDFVLPGFYQEQQTKTALTKRMQGLEGTLEELVARYPSSEQVALGIVDAVNKGEFIICKDSSSASLLFTGMQGPSPKRGFGVFDSLMGVIVGWFVWPFLRRRWEHMCREDGRVERDSLIRRNEI